MIEQLTQPNIQRLYFSEDNASFIIGRYIHDLGKLPIHAFKILTFGTLLLCFFSSFGQDPNTWTQKADVGGSERYNAVGFSIDGKGYLGTGKTNVTTFKDFWEYDPINDVWTQKADYGGGARYAAVGFSIGSKGYIGTGRSSNGLYQDDFWEYNPITNSWQQKNSFDGGAREEATGFSIGDKGYIGTGKTSVNKDDFWQYDPSSDLWIQKAKFGGSARYSATGFSIDDKGYMGTGRDNTERSDFWEYNSVSNSWKVIAGIPPLGRSSAVSFTIDGKGYVGTGFNSASSGTYFNDLYEYDISSNIWIKKANFGGAVRSLAVGFAINGKGYIGSGSEGGNYYKDFWEYSPGCSDFVVYADLDGDNFGDIANSAIAVNCLIPENYVKDSSDCNDLDSSINPGSSEISNGIDDNCNGVIDDGVICFSPINLSVQNISATTATLTWQYPGNPVAFRIRYDAESSPEILKRVNGTISTITISGLNPNTTYSWGVETVCSSANLSDFTHGGRFKTQYLKQSMDQNFPWNEIVEIFPNPSSGNLTIKLGTEALENLVNVQIISLMGQVVYNHKTAFSDNQLLENVQFNHSIPDGTYFVKILIGKKIFISKIELER